MAVVALQPAHAQAKSKFGVTVDECVHGDMDEYDQNFCSDKLMQSYAKIAKSTPANFDGNKVLHIFKGKGGDRIVVIDKTTKKVYTEQGAFQTLTSPYANVKSEKNKSILLIAILTKCALKANIWPIEKQQILKAKVNRYAFLS